MVNEHYRKFTSETILNSSCFGNTVNVIEFICYFRQEDVLDTDLSQATAVVSFLVPRHLKLIKPKLGILKSLIQYYRTKLGLNDCLKCS
jgi:hypothetical protein